MKRLIFSFLSLLLSLNAFSQWECRSQLSSSLKPLGKSKVYWAVELTGSSGYLDNNAIFNSMGFLGVDISSKKSTLFIETGYKFWDRYDLSQKNNFKNGHFGIRELFYQYKWKKGRATFGVQSASFDENYLLNERIFGLNIKNSNGPWSLNFNAGSVIKGFARNGIFCSVGYLCDIIPGRGVGVLGDKIGETNLAGFTLSYSPLRKKGEFNSKKADFNLASAGLLAYSEFGSIIEKPFVMSGIYADINLPYKFLLKPEVIFQAADLNNAIIYSLGIEKEYSVMNTRSIFNLRYFGINALDNDAKVLNSFSNIFAGEVLRLDSKDMPLIQFAVKTSLRKYKTHIKLQYSSQMKSSPLKEFDFEVGKRFNSHFQINAIGAFVKSISLPDNALLARVECRISF